MKYTYFFLMIAFVPSASHTMQPENSAHITIEIKNNRHKHVPLHRSKKNRSQHVRLDRHGIDGTNGDYQVDNNETRFNIKILHKAARV